MQMSIKAVRVTRGLTQADVALALGLSTATYNKLENDPGRFRLAQAQRLASILGVDVGSLFFGRESTSDGIALTGAEQ